MFYQVSPLTKAAPGGTHSPAAPGLFLLPSIPKTPNKSGRGKALQLQVMDGALDTPPAAAVAWNVFCDDYPELLLLSTTAHQQNTQLHHGKTCFPRAAQEAAFDRLQTRSLLVFSPWPPSAVYSVTSKQFALMAYMALKSH